MTTLALSQREIGDFKERLGEMYRTRYGRIGIIGQQPSSTLTGKQVAQTRVAEWLADHLPRETINEAASIAFEYGADTREAIEIPH